MPHDETVTLINDLPINIRELAIANCEEREDIDKYLLIAFVWKDTLEGFEFWDQIDQGNYKQWEEALENCKAD